MLASRVLPGLKPAVCPRSLAFKPVAAPRLAQPSRGALVVVAAEAKPAAKKKTPSPVKRADLNEERRAYNRQIKSACATRVKKAIKAAEALLQALPASEAELAPLDKLIAEAYKQLDQARTKGVIHVNTGGRRKARIARYRRKVLIAAGLFKPDESHPDFALAQKLAAKK